MLVGFLATAGVVFALLLSARWWLGPILVRRNVRQTVPEFLVAAEEEIARLPADSSGFLLRTRDELAALGFAAAGWLRHGQEGGVEACILVAVDRDGGDGAEAVAVVVPPGVPIRVPAFVEFSTHYADGTVVDTSNAGDVSPVPPGPGRHGARFPEAREPRDLHAIHMERLRRHGSGPKRAALEGGAADQFGRDYVESMEAQTRTGYFWFDAAAKAYRPTWKGAWIMTWSQLPPFQGMILRRQARRNRRFLAEIGREQMGE